ncbi:hypothetical protein BV22DRAFT_515646 [Leucogyrophana mollusca]|uniref:Uncharacterized protein n=1 Tax=Leucogyrophana mollusca TaxID=85980 RepID=A0ACB8BIH6_9AGAM|nr:hypothetical protein BV22DRAFT_515646 [Leucogyrophana mollusca]
MPWLSYGLQMPLTTDILFIGDILSVLVHGISLALFLHMNTCYHRDDMSSKYRSSFAPYVSFLVSFGTIYVDNSDYPGGPVAYPEPV